MTAPRVEILQWLDGLLTQGRKDEVMNYLKSLPDDERKELRRHLTAYNQQKETSSAPLRGSADATLHQKISKVVSPRSTDVSDSTTRGKSSTAVSSAQNNSLARTSPQPSSVGRSTLIQSDSGRLPASPLSRSDTDSLISKYNLSELLGKGQFSKVYKAVNGSTGQVVAVKQIEKDMLSPDKLPGIMKEAELLQTLSHENIVRLVEVCETRQHLFFVLEYVDGGSLYKCVKKHGVFPEPLLAYYIAQVLHGLKYLHEKGVIHRDIKGSNILMRKDGRVKLADFGSCTESAVDKKFTVVGTPYWMAPEIISMQGTSTLSDIWSLGCTVIELLTGSPPYFDLGTMAALFHMVEDVHPPIPESCSAELRNFLLACFRKDIKSRPSAYQLLDHVWIKSAQAAPINISSSHDVKDTVRRYNAERKQNRSHTAPAPVQSISSVSNSSASASGNSSSSSSPNSSTSSQNQRSRPTLASMFTEPGASTPPASLSPSSSSSKFDSASLRNATNPTGSTPPISPHANSSAVNIVASSAANEGKASSSPVTTTAPAGKSLLGFIASGFSDSKRTNSPKPGTSNSIGHSVGQTLSGTTPPSAASSSPGGAPSSGANTPPLRESSGTTTSSTELATMFACLPEELKLKLKEIARANISKQMVEQIHRDLDVQLRSLTEDRQLLLKNIDDLRRRVEALKNEKEILYRERANLQKDTETMIGEMRGAAVRSPRPISTAPSQSNPHFDSSSLRSASPQTLYASSSSTNLLTPSSTAMRAMSPAPTNANYGGGSSSSNTTTSSNVPPGPLNSNGPLNSAGVRKGT